MKQNLKAERDIIIESIPKAVKKVFDEQDQSKYKDGDMLDYKSSIKTATEKIEKEHEEAKVIVNELQDLIKSKV